MAPGIKFCMSSILRRPESKKTIISPDASMLRKLVRHGSCHPVLRGILDTLLLYLIQDLKLFATNGMMEKSGSVTVAERNTRYSDAANETPETRRQLHAGWTLFPPGESKRSRGPNPVNVWGLGHGAGKRSGDSTPRRLTRFQLLQSKFTRSTPKPATSHQRNVGTLSSSRGTRGDANPGQDRGGERDASERNLATRELNKPGSVKETVAKFAAAEQKEQGLSTRKEHPSKARLPGRRMLLSSLMERFESVACVRKESNFKCTRGRETTFLEGCKKLLPDQTVHTPNQRVPAISKSTGQQLRGKHVGHAQKQILHVSQKDSNHLKQGQTEEEPLNQNTGGDCSFRQMKGEDAKGRRLGRRDETHYIVNRLKSGDVQLLCLASATEWLPPEPDGLPPQPSWHAATVVTCPPVPASLQQRLREITADASENSTHVKTDGRCRAPRHADTPSAAPEPCGVAGEGPVKPQIEQIFEDRGDESPLEEVCTDSRLPRYAIPRVYRCGHDPSDSACQPAHRQEALNPSLSAPIPVLVTVENVQGFDLHPANETRPRTISEGRREKTDKEAREETAATQVGSRDAGSKAGFEGSQSSGVTLPDIQPSTEKPTQRPKYTTINYGDPAVRQTYKPKTIRFTDTFTF